MLELIVGGILIWLGITLLKNKNGIQPQGAAPVQHIKNQYNFYCDPTFSKDVERLLVGDVCERKMLSEPDYINCGVVEQEKTDPTIKYSNKVERKDFEQEKVETTKTEPTIKFKKEDVPTAPMSIKLNKKVAEPVDKDFFQETLIIDEKDEKRVVVVDSSNPLVYSDTRTEPVNSKIMEKWLRNE